jgi:2-polyprenyl-3-methyl-5-hydroxy-6-metoxy-1,4-benzoquinol methylase
MIPSAAIALPSQQELQQLFLEKHGRPEKIGWAPRRRHSLGYYLPADIYEATVKRLVFEGCRWIDVGCGHSIFPENESLSRSLASRCSSVVGVDPSDNIRENRWVHERYQCSLEDYHTDHPFDLATMRMVVEHVQEPRRLIASLRRLVRPGGVLVILTVSLWSPLTIASRMLPFALHHPVKRLLWTETEEEDSFPTHYNMNTRSALRTFLEAGGFREAAFARLADLSTFGQFRWLNYVELLAWRLCRRMEKTYPEHCLLGIYVRQAEP